MIKKLYPYMLVNKLVKQQKFTKSIAQGIIKYVGIEEQEILVILAKYNQRLGWNKLLQYPILRFLHQKLICSPKETVEDYHQFEQFLLNLDAEKHESMIYALLNRCTHSKTIREFYDDVECISEVDIPSLKYYYAQRAQCFYLKKLVDEYNQNPQPELIQYIELIVKENVMKCKYFKILEDIISECQPEHFKDKIIVPKDVDDMLTPYLVMAKLVLSKM